LFCVTLNAQAVGDGFGNWQERWDDYVQRTFGWKRVSAIAAESAFTQTFQPRSCGRPPYCFPDDMGSALARRTTRTTLELAAGALLHEDLRRRPSGLRGWRRRVMFALIHAPLVKDDEGDWRPAYSRYIGTMGAVTVTRAWRGRPITTGHLFRSFGWSATTYFSDSLFTEFEPDLRRIGTNAWRNHFRPMVYRFRRVSANQ
jgi:hypothetical protein